MRIYTDVHGLYANMPFWYGRKGPRTNPNYFMRDNYFICVLVGSKQYQEDKGQICYITCRFLRMWKLMMTAITRLKKELLLGVPP